MSITGILFSNPVEKPDPETDKKINVKVLDFNGTFITPPSSQLDETDVNAPKNLAAGAAGSVVSQVYKSSAKQTYTDKGPVGGHY